MSTIRLKYDGETVLTGTQATAQIAYDMAKTIQTNLGGIVVIEFGEGTFGNIVLTSVWNSSVHLAGQGSAVTTIGNVTGGFSVNTTLADLTTGNFVVGTGNSLTLVGNGAGNVVVGSLNAASTGFITVTDLTFFNMAAFEGGTVMGTRIVGDATNGTIDVSGSLTGSISLTDSVASALKVNVPAGVAAPVTLVGTRLTGFVVSATLCTIFTSPSGTLPVVKATNSQFDERITGANGASRFDGCRFRTGSGTAQSCINNIDSSGAVFLNSVLDPDGAASIAASVARTIVAYNVKSRVALHANVTLSEGDYTFSANIDLP